MDRLYVLLITLGFLVSSGLSQTTSNPDSSNDSSQEEGTEGWNKTLQDNLVAIVAVMGAALVLILIFNIWFCCSIRTKLRRQLIYTKVNESDIQHIRQYIKKLEARLKEIIPTFKTDDVRDKLKRCSIFLEAEPPPPDIIVVDESESPVSAAPTINFNRTASALIPAEIGPDKQTDQPNEGDFGPVTEYSQAGENDDILEESPYTLPGEFVVQEIGPTGGVISFKGVKLTVPPGALDEIVKIRVGIMWGKEFVPNVDEDAALLGPVVCCEPHGQKFKKRVVLTLPHCAVNPNTDWNLSVKKCETPVNTVTRNTKLAWKNEILDDYDKVTETSIEIGIKHFTLYTIIGYLLGPAAKWVHLVAFSSFKEEDNFLEPTVYCANHYEEAEGLERKQRHDFQKLKFERNGGNVLVDLKDLPTGWKLHGEPSEELDFEAIWKTGWDRCKFVLEKTVLSESSVYIEMACRQKNNDENRCKTLKLTQEATRKCNHIRLTSYWIYMS